MIKVTSRKGLGTRFDIYPPPSDKKIATEEAIRAKLLKGEESILLVDDEDINIEVMKEILEMLGYQVFAAGNGTEALRIYPGTGRDDRSGYTGYDYAGYKWWRRFRYVERNEFQSPCYSLYWLQPEGAGFRHHEPRMPGFYSETFPH